MGRRHSDRQHYVTVNVSVSSEALRRGLASVEEGSHDSLDELVDVLLLNSPTAYGATRQADGTSDEPDPADTDAHDRLPLPTQALQAKVAPTPDKTRGELHFLTNRLNPVKVSLRVLANMSTGGEGPDVGTFHEGGSRVARSIGIALRLEDREARRRAAARRFIGYPVGDDEHATLDRFAYSFMIGEAHGRATGPLAILGLADVVDGRVLLTSAGIGLADAPSPLLDGGEGTLSAKEIELLRERLMRAVDERKAIVEFLGAVHRAAGAQPRVDELLATWHSDWTSDRAAAHRAAMLGRLGELRVLRVTGRGSRAMIELLDTDGFEE